MSALRYIESHLFLNGKARHTLVAVDRLPPFAEGGNFAAAFEQISNRTLAACARRISERRYAELLAKFNCPPLASAPSVRETIADMSEPHRRTAASNPSRQRYVPRIAGRIPSILIVDSYIDEAEMYTQYLCTRGADANHVRRPEDAFSRISDAPPVVVVADMVFKWSAYDAPRFLRDLRERPECALTRFIVVSGYTTRGDRQRARVAGADRFLLKPCRPDKLWRHISAVIRTEKPLVQAAGDAGRERAG
jgi:CheY-like chemotaxis protein